MKVAVSAFVLPKGDGPTNAGVGRHIVHTLDTIATLDLGHTYQVYLPDTFRRPAHWDESPWTKWHPIELPRERDRAKWEHVRMGREAARIGADVLFCVFPAVPLYSRVPIVSVIHDAFPRTRPDEYDGRSRFILDRLHALAASRSKRVVTVSEWSADEIARAYRIPRDRLVVAYNGLGNAISPEGEADLSEFVGEGERYLLTLSTLEPRKNFVGLLRAFGALREKHPDLKLLVAGARGWKESAIFEEAAAFGDSVRFLGYVPDAAVGPLMRRAELFVLPSLVEGFGIPALEAMAAGAAVACSGGSSLPEVTGDLAYSFDPETPTDIARAIETALADPYERARRAAEGPNRASQFSWERSLRSVERAWNAARTTPSGR